MFDLICILFGLIGTLIIVKYFSGNFVEYYDPRWIRVEDEYPDDDQKIFIYTSGMVTTSYRPEYSRNGELVDGLGHKVKYWMPYPKPPTNKMPKGMKKCP